MSPVLITRQPVSKGTVTCSLPPLIQLHSTALRAFIFWIKTSFLRRRGGFPFLGWGGPPTSSMRMLEGFYSRDRIARIKEPWRDSWVTAYMLSGLEKRYIYVVPTFCVSFSQLARLNLIKAHTYTTRYKMCQQHAFEHWWIKARYTYITQVRP